MTNNALVKRISDGRQMNLYTMLAARSAAGRPCGWADRAGKFGSMILSQAQHIEGMHVVGVADLDVGKARASLPASAGPPSATAPQAWATPSRPARPACSTMRARSRPCDEIECIIEATGHPIAGVRHALAAIDGGKHV
jgi:predicted homoserine dehydrogenase-like protein